MAFLDEISHVQGQIVWCVDVHRQIFWCVGVLSCSLSYILMLVRNLDILEKVEYDGVLSYSKSSNSYVTELSS